VTSPQTLLDREQIEPIMISGGVPLCMEQYKRTFCTSRIPGLQEGVWTAFFLPF
jgi:hypothetical protein